MSSDIAINTFICVAMTFQKIFQKIQHSCHLKEKHKLNTMLLFKCHKKVKNFLTCENIKTLCPSFNFFNILANKTNFPDPSLNSLISKWPFSFFLASWSKHEMTNNTVVMHLYNMLSYKKNDVLMKAAVEKR